MQRQDFGNLNLARKKSSLQQRAFSINLIPAKAGFLFINTFRPCRDWALGRVLPFP